MRLPRPTALDIIVILISAASALGALSLAAAPGGGSPILEVKTPDAYFAYALDRDARLSFDGDLGATEVEISGGKAHVSDSACANKLCVHSPPIAKPGEWIACLPNRVILRVRGGSDKETADAGSW